MKCKRFVNDFLRNEEWFQFYSEFNALAERYTPTMLDIDALYNTFLQLYAQADAAIEVIRKSATTEQIATADNARDMIFRGFSDAVTSAVNHFDKTKREAALRIRIVFDHYGNIARMAYDEETASIHNFIQELTSTFTADIATLGLGDWVSQLDADNQQFDHLMKDRYSENSSKTAFRMKEERIKTDRCYRDILNRMDALMLVNGEEKYAPFVKELNVCSDRFEAIIAQRRGRRAKKNEQQPIGA